MALPDIPTVLSIAGSDPSGGAGIQADLKTFMAAGVYGMAVLAGLTAQNTTKVAAAIPVSADFVKKQLESVFSDIRVDAIKLGMLPNREICQAIVPFLGECPVVCDPVMVATSGGQLIDTSAVSALMELILPRSDFVTPNLYELGILYGKPVEDLVDAGMSILVRYPNLNGIALKGGHRPDPEGTVTDIFLYRNSEGGISQLSEIHAFIDTQNTHGTGCTFSSALAAGLAKKEEPADAFVRAVRLTHRLIEVSRDARIGHGHGPLLHHRFMVPWVFKREPRTDPKP